MMDGNLIESDEEIGPLSPYICSAQFHHEHDKEMH